MWFRRRSRGVTESEKALADARRNLHEVIGRSLEVREVATALQRFRERNHFAEQLEQLIKYQGPHNEPGS